MAVLRLRELHKIKRWDGFDINKVNQVWNQLDDIGRFILDMKVRLGNKDGNFNGIKDAWKGKPAFVVGASINLRGFDLRKLDGLHTIGINHMIEYYDGFEWFIFLDNRFLKRTSYNIDNFPGKIFSSNRCMILSDHLDWYRFKVKPFNSTVSLDINHGLFNASMTGLCALNLALISGADPIYMLGCDTPKDSTSPISYHYEKNYTGEIKDQTKLNKYVGSYKHYEKFIPFKNRIVNVGAGCIKTFKRISLDELERKLINIPRTRKPKEKIHAVKVIPIAKPKESSEAIICHMISMSHMDQMGDISRQVFNQSSGKHIWCHINNPPPKADIYLLECFINGHEKYINFKKPFPNSKVISLIHSSGRCMPAKCSDAVLTLTHGWRAVLKQKGFGSVVIPAGIDTDLYNKYSIDYNQKTFGRITRWSGGKVHPHWNNLAQNILTIHSDAKCIMITRTNQKIKNKRAVYIEDITIADHEKKAKALSQISVFADMHHTFQETFSLCLLEAMAAGCACVLYSTVPQPAMVEILSGAGIICTNENDFSKKLITLIQDTEMKKEYGIKAKNKAKLYSIKNMIESYNKLFKGVLGL